jgi:hypothetical protein
VVQPQVVVKQVEMAHLIELAAVVAGLWQAKPAH